MTTRIIVTAAVLLGSFAGAQVQPTETIGGIKQVSQSEVTSQYLRLSDNRGSLRATLVSSGGSAAAIRTSTLKQSGTWFASVHPHTSLTAVADYYLKAFTQLGFKRTDKSVTKEVVMWTLQKGGRQVSAVFHQQAEGVVANISWL